MSAEIILNTPSYMLQTQSLTYFLRKENLNKLKICNLYILMAWCILTIMHQMKISYLWLWESFKRNFYQNENLILFHLLNSIQFSFKENVALNFFVSDDITIEQIFTKKIFSIFIFLRNVLVIKFHKIEKSLSRT